MACVASVSVGFSARSKRFSLFGDAEVGANATLMEAAYFFALAPIFARSRSVWHSWHIQQQTGLFLFLQQSSLARNTVLFGNCFVVESNFTY